MATTTPLIQLEGEKKARVKWVSFRRRKRRVCLYHSCRVSSVLNRDLRQFGKQFMFDGSEETCWNSDQVQGSMWYILWPKQCRASVIGFCYAWATPMSARYLVPILCFMQSCSYSCAGIIYICDSTDSPKALITYLNCHPMPAYCIAGISPICEGWSGSSGSGERATCAVPGRICRERVWTEGWRRRGRGGRQGTDAVLPLRHQQSTSITEIWGTLLTPRLVVVNLPPLACIIYYTNGTLVFLACKYRLGCVCPSLFWA